MRKWQHQSTDPLHHLAMPMLHLFPMSMPCKFTHRHRERQQKNHRIMSIFIYLLQNIVDVRDGDDAQISAIFSKIFLLTKQHPSIMNVHFHWKNIKMKMKLEYENNRNDIVINTFYMLAFYFIFIKRYIELQ